MPAYKKSAEMRRNIMDTMRQLVLEKGYSKTSITEVADRLGVSRALLYYYFTNKNDIMIALYDEQFHNLDSIALKVFRQDEDPLAWLMLKYIIFHRKIVTNPLFNEFIILSPDFASVGLDTTAEMSEQYYSDSYRAFKHYGKSADTNEFRIHVLMTEAVSRAFMQGEYYKTIHLTERETMEQFGSRTVMLTFGLTSEEFCAILDKAFDLADQLELN